jgi:hypothetical protein
MRIAARIARALLLLAGTVASALLIGFVALLLWPLPDMPAEGVGGDFLIRDVGVIDVRGGRLLQGRYVVVRGGVITAVSEKMPSSRPEALIEIDGEGKFLVPGLWDMHTHSSKLAQQYYHPLLIANGVTGVREMWGCMSEPDSFVGCTEDRLRWNDALADGSGLSPRFVQQGSFQINGGSEVPDGFPTFFKARDAGELRQLAAFYAAAGVDFLKIYSELPRDAYFGLATEARKQGLALAGHRPMGVSLQELFAAGQRSVEHPRLFLFECFAAAADFRALPDPLAAYDQALRRRLANEHDDECRRASINAMAASDTWWVPTLQVLQMSALAGDEKFRSDPRLDYIPFLIRAGMWMPDADRAARENASQTGRNVHGLLYRMATKHVAEAHAAGVKILLGTDAGDTYVFPGFSVHDELAAFVAAGISPAAAIKSATIDAAAFAGLDADYGSIQTGKAADMLLLDGNPLADVHNTRRIAGLFFNGQYYDRQMLDRLLDFAARRANSVHTNAHLLWAVINSPIVRVQLAD